MTRDQVCIGMYVRVTNRQYLDGFGRVKETIRGPGSMLSVLVEFLSPRVEARWITSDRLESASLLEMIAEAAKEDDE